MIPMEIAQDIEEWLQRESGKLPDRLRTRTVSYV